MALSDQQVEFLDSWLVLVERFVNPKAVLETPHSLPVKNGFLTKRLMFNSNGFLGHIHMVSDIMINTMSLLRHIIHDF